MCSEYVTSHNPSDTPIVGDAFGRFSLSTIQNRPLRHIIVDQSCGRVTFWRCGRKTVQVCIGWRAISSVNFDAGQYWIGPASCCVGSDGSVHIDTHQPADFEYPTCLLRLKATIVLMMQMVEHSNMAPQKAWAAGHE